MQPLILGYTLCIPTKYQYALELLVPAVYAEILSKENLLRHKVSMQREGHAQNRYDDQTGWSKGSALYCVLLRSAPSLLAQTQSQEKYIADAVKHISHEENQSACLSMCSIKVSHGDE